MHVAAPERRHDARRAQDDEDTEGDAALFQEATYLRTATVGSDSGAERGLDLCEMEDST